VLDLAHGHDNLPRRAAAAGLGHQPEGDEKPRPQQEEMKERFLEDLLHFSGVYQIGDV
jgi:hypothetical protein